MSMSAQKNGDEIIGREQASEEMIRAQDVINSSGGIFEDQPDEVDLTHDDMNQAPDNSNLKPMANEDDDEILG